jgi:hypothetical protein
MPLNVDRNRWACPDRFEALHHPFALPGRLVRVLGPVQFSTDVNVLRRKRWAVHAGCGTGDAWERVATPVLARSFRSLRRGCLWGVTLRRAARTSGGTVSSTSRKLSENRKYSHTQWAMISPG